MTIDKAQLKALAEAAADLEDIPERADEHAEANDALWQHMHCHTILALLAEIERLTEQRDEARQLRDKLGDRYDDAMSEIAGLRTGFDAQNEVIAGLKAENEALRKALLEASEEVATWGEYASEYFQKKHDLAGCVAKIHAAAMAKEAPHG